ncbi:hypothetical protein GCM10009424_15160 [Sphingomonas ursincola]|uniref:ApeA N-terminal domain-containing protein n=1 Tax=Sphingomonas ursincola TaxID=56361 RepID=A0A7V8U8M1_9SPHN|nr:hypothetical protein [Sphingomonas ursincola]MBA1374510.1 hypothetical protein [Sphingomonas ursincola]
MARDRLEKDTDYICCEQFTGRAIQGALRLSDDRIEVRLVSFDDFFFIDRDTEHLPLRLEDNSYATMHSAFCGGPGSYSSRTEKTHNQTISANTLTHGPDEWKPDDPIRHVTFELPRAEAFLRYDPKIKELESNSPWSEIDTYAFAVELPELTVRLGYRSTVSMVSERVRVEAPVFVIDFAQPRSIKTYLEDVQTIVRFVSSVLGLTMHPENIRIRRVSDEEMRSSVEKGDFLGDHSVTEMWFSKSHQDDGEARPYRAFVGLFDEEEMRAFRACLRVWIEREPEWARSNALMIECLRLQREISAERMLAACKWLEEVPTAKAVRVTDDSIVKIIVDAALQAADQLGQDRLKARIPQALERLTLESHRERFERLVTKIADRFGPGVVHKDMPDHLIAALRDFRGKVAHGHYEPQDDAESEAFARSIFAVEALCLLLTCFDMPMTANGLEWIRDNPLVEHYRLFSLN